MEKKDKIKLFNDEKIRTKWDSEIEEYYVSVVDVVGILSGSKNPKDYWYRLKKRELENGVDLSINCRQLKMLSFDGKLRKTDVATPKEMLRIIQSIPSPKA